MIQQVVLYLSKQEMLAFQTSGGIEVKKYVTHFMEVAWYVMLSVRKLFWPQNAIRLGIHTLVLRLVIEIASCTVKTEQIVCQFTELVNYTSTSEDNYYLLMPGFNLCACACHCDCILDFWCIL